MKTGFILSVDKTGKDQGKANYAGAYIGFGVAGRRSSTEIYPEDARGAGLPVNEEIIPDEHTVAFVSVAGEGIHAERTAKLAPGVIAAGGTVIMDAPGTGFGQSRSCYNRNGEGKVQDAPGKPSGQTREGYNFWGPPGKLTVQRRKTKTALIASARTESLIKEKIENFFALDIELEPVDLPGARCRREWKILHSTGITDGYRVTTKSSGGICRFRFEKIMKS